MSWRALNPDQDEQRSRERQRQRELNPPLDTPRADLCAKHGGNGDPEWCFFCSIEGQLNMAENFCSVHGIPKDRKGECCLCEWRAEDERSHKRIKKDEQERKQG